MIKGLRRSAGLNLISFGVSKNIEPETFFDLLQWFLTSVRANKQSVAHYTDGISGCGDSIIDSIRKEFFKIIKAVITMIKTTRDTARLSELLNSLVWNYKG